MAVASGGTGAATLTAHGVLIGEGTGAIAATAAGTAGQALLSGGASADPSFGNLAVAAGGTGRTTLAAHAVLLGEGTAGLNTVAPATAGQALISAGAAADPVFGAPTGALLNVQKITSTGTYTPTTGTNSVIIYLVGGGGGSGGCGSTSSGQVSMGVCGSAGGVCVHRMTSGFSGQTVTIGAGGAAGVAGANAGGAGGNSTFGSILTAGGGTSGNTLAPTGSTGVAGTGSVGSTSTGGNILNTSSVGPYSIVVSLGILFSTGAGNMFVAGSTNVQGGTTSGAAVGQGFGGGASAPTNGPSAAAQAGAAGAAGVCIIYEYA